MSGSRLRRQRSVERSEKAGCQDKRLFFDSFIVYHWSHITGIIMRIVVAVDWSDQSFNAVQETVRLYSPQELTLVHAVDLGFLEKPAVAQAMNVQGYDEYRKGMVAAGQELLNRCAALLPARIATVRRVCKVGSPAPVILDAVQAEQADLVVLGARERGRIGELFLGSVSHRVLVHAPCSVYIVKRPMAELRRILLPIEETQDASRIHRWFIANPIGARTDMTILHVVPIFRPHESVIIPQLELWTEKALRSAHELVNEAVALFRDAGHTVAGRVLKGEPVDVIAEEAATHDLVIAGSHARKGLERFLLGSVSHTLSHRVAGPILIVR